MGRVLTNNISLAYAIEQSLGVLPGSPTWFLLEPNSLSSFGPVITTVERSPISKNRQRKKGTVTDLDSSVEFEHDLTLNAFIDFVESFAFASFNGGATFVPTAVTSGGSGGYTVAAGGDLTASTLVFARGFLIAANNGLNPVASGSTTTNIRVDGLTAEASPPTNVSVEVAGVRGVSGDIQIDANGDLISTALDFTTLDLTVGQVLHIGGELTANKFATADNFGFARIITITANLMTLDKKATTFVVDAGAGKLIDLLFGRFIRNVDVDDVDYLEQSIQFEAAYPNLDSPGPGDEYEYSIGNFANQLTFQLPLADKAIMTFGFIGTDTEAPVDVQKTGASTPIEPVQTVAFNTSADIARLRITQLDESGLTTDFKSLTLTLNNNVSPEKVLSTLGAKFMNTGNFEVNIEAQLLFTDSAVAAAVRANTTVTMDFSLKNDDGGIFVDIPSLTLGGGDKEFPVNETVLINLTSTAFEDPTLGTSLGISIFPFLP